MIGHPNQYHNNKHGKSWEIVVTITIKVSWKIESLAPCRSETSKNIKTEA